MVSLSKDWSSFRSIQLLAPAFPACRLRQAGFSWAPLLLTWFWLIFFYLAYGRALIRSSLRRVTSLRSRDLFRRCAPRFHFSRPPNFSGQAVPFLTFAFFSINSLKYVQNLFLTQRKALESIQYPLFPPLLAFFAFLARRCPPFGLRSKLPACSDNLRQPPPPNDFPILCQKDCFSPPLLPRTRRNTKKITGGSPFTQTWKRHPGTFLMESPFSRRLFMKRVCPPRRKEQRCFPSFFPPPLTSNASPLTDELVAFLDVEIPSPFHPPAPLFHSHFFKRLLVRWSACGDAFFFGNSGPQVRTLLPFQVHPPQWWTKKSPPHGASRTGEFLGLLFEKTFGLDPYFSISRVSRSF